MRLVWEGHGAHNVVVLEGVQRFTRVGIPYFATVRLEADWMKRENGLRGEVGGSSCG